MSEAVGDGERDVHKVSISSGGNVRSWGSEAGHK